MIRRWRSLAAAVTAAAVVVVLLLPGEQAVAAPAAAQPAPARHQFTLIIQLASAAMP